MDARHRLGWLIAAALTLAASPPLNVQGQPPVDPRPTCMLIDLEGDGIPLVAKPQGVLFGLDGDGGKERVGWTRAGARDGFLALDINKNGVVDGGQELMGNRLPVSGRRLATGLRALIAMQDGVVLGPDGRASTLPPDAGRINKDDRIHADLRVWIDANHDGLTSPGELATLDQAGISAIGTGMRGSSTIENGSEILMIGSVMISKRGVGFPRPLVELRLAR